MSLLLYSCSIFSIDIDTKIEMPSWPYSVKPDYFLVRYQLNGDLNEVNVVYGKPLVVNLPKEELVIFTAYPQWESIKLAVKPAGLILRTGSVNCKLSWDSGALASAIFPYSDQKNLNRINVERLINTLKDKKMISIWDFDYNNIVKDLAEGDFNYYSIDRLETWQFDIPSIQGSWIPDDTDREVVEVTPNGIFSFNVPQGSHRYISFEEKLIKEIYVNEKGELLVVDRPF